MQVVKSSELAFPDGLTVQDPALSLLRLGSLLWLGFDPWPGDFHMLRVWPEKKSSELQLLYPQTPRLGFPSPGFRSFTTLDSKCFEVMGVSFPFPRCPRQGRAADRQEVERGDPRGQDTRRLSI